VADLTVVLRKTWFAGNPLMMASTYVREPSATVSHVGRAATTERR